MGFVSACLTFSWLGGVGGLHDGPRFSKRFPSLFVFLLFLCKWSGSIPQEHIWLENKENLNMLFKYWNPQIYNWTLFNVPPPSTHTMLHFPLFVSIHGFCFVVPSFSGTWRVNAWLASPSLPLPHSWLRVIGWEQLLSLSLAAVTYRSGDATSVRCFAGGWGGGAFIRASSAAAADVTDSVRWCEAFSAATAQHMDIFIPHANVDTYSQTQTNSPPLQFFINRSF